MRCTSGCSQGLRLWRKHVNKFPLSPLIINDTISSWAVWQVCHRFIVDCLAGSHLSRNKLNNYWFPVSEAPRWIVSLRWENEHTQHLSVHFCWWVLYDFFKKKENFIGCVAKVCWIHKIAGMRRDSLSKLSKVISLMVFNSPTLCLYYRKDV